MQSHKDTFLHIDDFCTPRGVNEGFVQREQPTSMPVIPEGATLGEILTGMSNMGWQVSDDRYKAEKKKRGSAKKARLADMSAKVRASRNSRKG